MCLAIAEEHDSRWLTEKQVMCQNREDHEKVEERTKKQCFPLLESLAMSAAA